MKANVLPLETEKIYHIYNRGIDGCTIFQQEKHYLKFLEKYAYHLEHIVDTYAYCLLNNHFHFLIKIKPESIIYNNFPHLASKNISKVISSQFSHFFNGYAQYYNYDLSRTGGLFEHSFRRKYVNNDIYFSRMIYYIHFNPQNHGFIDDFKNYKYSSYHSHISKAETKLNKTEVLKWFGGADDYKKFHNLTHDLTGIADLEIEVY